MKTNAIKKQQSVTFTLPPAIIEMHRFVSNDENRHNLTNVQVISLPDGRLQATATCGHMLARIELHDTGVSFAEPVYIYGKFLKSLKIKKNETATFTQDSSGYGLAWGDTRIGGPVDTIHFPDCDQVIPHAKEEDNTSANVWGVDAMLIARCYDYLRKAGMKTNVKFEAPSDKLAPMRLTAESFDDQNRLIVATFVIMPMRI